MWLEKIFRGLPSHVHGDLVDADGVQLPGLRAGEDVALLEEDLAGGGVGHRSQEGVVRPPGPNRASFLLNLYRPTMLRS